MQLSAFNLIPQLVVERPNGDVSVVGRVERDVDTELVFGRYRSGEPFAFDFNEDVSVVGVVATMDAEDDFGTKEADGRKEI